jgi:hypothetical protein
MNVRRSFVLASAALAGLFACSSSSPATVHPDASMAPMTLSAFCSAFMTANSAILARCLGGAASVWATEVPAQYSCASLEAAVAAGRVTYDGSQAASCLDAYPTLSCSDLLVGPPACTGPLGGTIANAAACFTDGDCGGADYCSGAAHGTAACQGTCAPLLAAGAACSASEECVSGFTCGGNPSSPTCISDVHPLANKGESCAALPPTMPSIQCAPGLSCELHTTVCEPTVADGAACTPGQGLCETFTYCDPTTMTCKAYAGSGGVCGTTPAQETMGCLPQTWCKMQSPMDPTGVCSPLGGAQAACSGDYQCISGACVREACTAPCTEE